MDICMQLNHSLLAAEKQPYKPIELYAIVANTTNVVKAPVHSSSGLYMSTSSSISSL